MERKTTLRKRFFQDMLKDLWLVDEAAQALRGAVQELLKGPWDLLFGTVIDQEELLWQ